MADHVKLLGLEASFPCARVVWALKLKGVSYEFITEDLTNKSQLLLEMNPIYKKVPVLIHNQKPIVESLIILEYIDETWKTDSPFMPQDPYECAMARFWAKYSDEKVVLTSWMAMRVDGEEKAIEAAQEALGFLEKQIEGKKFFGGEREGYLDLALGWIALWLPAMEEVGKMKVLDSVKFPGLSEWTQNFIQVPGIHESLPLKESCVNYFQFGLDYLRALEAKKE